MSGFFPNPTGYLYELSKLVVDSMHLQTYEDANKDLLKAITKPFTKLIVEVSIIHNLLPHFKESFHRQVNAKKNEAKGISFFCLFFKVDSKEINKIATDGETDISLLKTCCKSKTITKLNMTGSVISEKICTKNCKSTL